MIKIAVAIFALLICCTYSLNRNEFPPNFKFGTATASYQIEGAYNEDGKGPNIWDYFTHLPNKTYKGQTGDVADDHYHRVEEDVQLMKQLGVPYYRMSLCWSRLIPTGDIRDGINQKGIDYYNNEINTLIKAGIQPIITLYHWDLPLGLHQKYGGWLNQSQIVQSFVDYADLAFRSFGDRVKYWITFNEPWCVSLLGYGSGVNAPGRCTKCTEGGNSGFVPFLLCNNFYFHPLYTATEPYIVTHNLLLAHAMTYYTYNLKYRASQNGKVGITLNIQWSEPMTSSTADQQAAQRNLEFQGSWFADPIFFGDYPQSMKNYVGSRLPTFTPEQKKFLTKSTDFFGLNHYTARYVYAPTTPLPKDGWWNDQNTKDSIYDKNGKQIGPATESDWLYIVPWACRKILNWIADRYGRNVEIIITENGMDRAGESNMPIAEALKDAQRIQYIHDYLENVRDAIREDHVNVTGYFVWSFMDNFEWVSGYQMRFGITYVDYENEQKRTFKNSAYWYRDFLAGK